jgi:hypothetical protein
MSSGKILTRADEAAELRGLALDMTQLCLDLAGIVDPTPISDGASALISLGRGQWLDAVLSGASMFPYIGDLAKAGKFPKYLKTLERAITLARTSERARELLQPVIIRLNELLSLLPANIPGQLEDLRNLVRRYLSEMNVKPGVLNRLPDISNRFNFRPRWRQGAYEFEEISGRLGVPGQVMTHRDVAAQRAISAGTGDHAGHRIGVQFGAPGDARNMSLQNANTNTRAPRGLHDTFQGPGGSYLDLETKWAQKLQQGNGVEVTVRDRYRPGEDRPISRFVEWTEIHPNGTRTTQQLEFLNTTSPQSRAVGNR